MYYAARSSTLYIHAPAYRVPVVVFGTIASHPRVSASSQGFILKTNEGARLSVTISPFEKLFYGDSLTLSGSVEPLSSTTNYLKKDRVVGVLAFPSIEKHTAAGWSMRGTLYGISDALCAVYARIFPPDEAALAAGIVLGQQNASFSTAFKAAMRNSGTTHIVALSGYNIMIVIGAVSFALSFLFRRHGQFWGSCAIVLLFVLMTGAESSVVRAALMGILVLVAQYTSRLYDFWHSAAIVAFLMVAWNPFALIFDVGFVLSFVSLFGIVVLAPRLAALVRITNPVLAGIGTIVAQTLGAQIAVLPILIATFGGFSWASALANIPILLIMPVSMALVFAAGCFGLAWLPAASLLAIIPHGLLWAQTRTILVFGSLPLQEAPFSWWAIAFYYGLIFIMLRALPIRARELKIDYV